MSSPYTKIIEITVERVIGTDGEIDHFLVATNSEPFGETNSFDTEDEACRFVRQWVKENV